MPTDAGEQWMSDAPRVWGLPIPERNADVVLSDSGDVVSAAPAAAAWLVFEGVSEALSSALRSRGPGWWCLAPLYVRCVRLESPTGVQFHLTIVPPRPALRDALGSLTETQLLVAEYAAAGATYGEIATAMERSPNTVRSHLKAVYRALHVGSRVELARVFGRPSISYGG